MVLPVLVLLLAASLGVFRGLSSELSAQDAAVFGARAAARGETDSAVHQLALSVAPPGAEVVVSRDGALVEVTVSAQVRPLGSAARLLPTITVRGHAEAEDEQVLTTQAAPAAGPPSEQSSLKPLRRRAGAL